MYMITGVQPNGHHLLLATPATARDALTEYEAALSQAFEAVQITSPDGSQLSAEDLGAILQAAENLIPGVPAG